MKTETNPSNRLAGIRDVCEQTSLSDVPLVRWQSDGRPAPIFTYQHKQS